MMFALKQCLPLVLALVALCACQTMPPAQRPAPDPATQMPALESRILALVGTERTKIDPRAKALRLDPELTKVARERARDMAAKHYLAHAAPNGDTSASLLMAQDATFQGLLGENLAAQHYAPQSGISVEDCARRFLETWLNSPPHKQNMAFADYDRTGIGAAASGGTVYVVLLFATDLGLPPHADGAATVTRYDSPRAARAASDEPAPPPVRLRGAMGVSGDTTVPNRHNSGALLTAH
ncbi:MAG TPA: CAP domain-containing protein [Rhizomicrobium sp.]|jgi:uncharacterized protein YkwD|nr:CAP domain-containing protein [Rhizomicrobium sp.]